MPTWRQCVILATAISGHLLVASLAGAAAAPDIVKLYQQCGGTSSSQCLKHQCADAPWRDVVCESATTCQRQSQYYWQCVKPQPKGFMQAGLPVERAQAPVEPASEAVGPADPAATAPIAVPADLAVVPTDAEPAEQAVTAPEAEDAANALAPKVPMSNAAPNVAAPTGTVAAKPTNVVAPNVPTKPANVPANPANVPTKPVNVPAKPANVPAKPANVPAKPTNVMAKPVNVPAKPANVPAKPTNVVAKPATVAAKVAPTNGAFTGRPNPDKKKGEWIGGRATFYGASPQIETAFLERGVGAFGVIEHGSCGYTQSDGSLPFAIDGYAAPADTNADYPGSCGRCYQVRCRTGVVMDAGKPVNMSQHYYMPSVNNRVKDDMGRSFPGNPKEKEGLQYVKCWDDNSAITIRIGDSCPCQQKLPSGEVRPQFWCCGGNNHFDLSYWAFQKLAHPLYGAIPIEYRPVSCRTAEPLDPLPGFVSDTIFGEDLGAGWGWRTYNAKNTKLIARGEGRGGSVGTCATASKEGAVPFICRECYKPGYQPFGKAKILTFWIKSNTKSRDPFASSTPPGKLPELKVFLMNDEKNLYCGTEITLGRSIGSSQKQGDYYKFDIPLSSFNCDKGSAGSLANINRVDFMNTNLRDADFCLDDIILLK